MKRGYHDKTWGRKMLEVGLRPTHNGKPNGKMTGYGMTHLIVEGGAFDRAADELLASGFPIHWRDRVGDGRSAKSGDKNEDPKPTRARFACPCCDQLAWAKHSANLVCGACNTRLLPFHSR